MKFRIRKIWQLPCLALLFVMIICFNGAVYGNEMDMCLFYLPSPHSTVYAVCDADILDNPDGNVCGYIERGDTTTVYGYDDTMEWAEIDGGWCYAGYLSCDYPVSITIQTDSDECEKYIGFTNTMISYVPSDILTDLVGYGYEITLTSSDIGADDLYYDGTDNEESTGVTIFNDTLCKSYVEADPLSIYSSVVHEIGHAFSWMLGEPCLDVDFQYVFEEEGMYADTPHHAENEREYFAACFRDYIEDGENAFGDLRPISYEYMKNLVSRYSEARS